MQIIRGGQNIFEANDFSFAYKMYLWFYAILFLLSFFLLESRLSVAILLTVLTIVSFSFILPRRSITVNKQSQTFRLQKNFLLFKTSKQYALKDVASVNPLLWESLEYVDYLVIYITLQNGKMIKIGSDWCQASESAPADAQKLATFIGVICHEPTPWKLFR